MEFGVHLYRSVKVRGFFSKGILTHKSHMEFVCLYLFPSETCDNPGTPKNGQRKGSDFRHGRNVTFTCQTDFKLLGSETLTCHDGTWSGRIPVCSGNQG